MKPNYVTITIAKFHTKKSKILQILQLAICQLICNMYDWKYFVFLYTCRQTVFTEILKPKINWNWDSICLLLSLKPNIIFNTFLVAVIVLIAIKHRIISFDHAVNATLF